MEELQKQIEAYIDSKHDEIIEKWRNLVNQEAFCADVEDTYNVANHVKALFEEAGVKCELIEPHENTPLVVCGVIGEDRPGQPVMLAGHYDTVFKKGFLETHPFVIDEEGHTHGPGCLDMKGGIVIAAYVIKALESIGYKDRPIKICFCGDEEAGKNHLYTAEVIKEAAKGCKVAFNMETGLPNNAVCTGRKGAAGGSFITHGVSAHSGNAFEHGRNAVVETAHKMIALDALTNMEIGTHVNVAIVNGGVMTNQVPDRCEVTWSVRFKSKEEMEKTLAAVDEIFAKTYVEGTTTEVGPIFKGNVFEENERNLALCEFVNKISAADGYGEVGHAFLGGGSDAPNLQYHGAVTLCSCGVLGEWNHTDREYAIVDSMYTRAKMWCDVIRHIDEFSI